MTDLVDRLRAAGCVFAEDEARLLVSEASTPEALETMVARRVDGLPLEQILGWVEFRGLRVLLEPGVFVPRRRTEFLVERACARTLPQPCTIVDLCCGSGAIGLALLETQRQARLHAVDIDPVAVRCATRNLGERGRVHEGDLDEPLPAELAGRVDLLVVNAPHVPSESIALMPPEARVHEPRRALDGGSDGLDLQRRTVAAAPRWLAPGGQLLVEAGERQASRVAELCSRRGLRAEVARSAERDATVITGTRV